MKCEKYKKKPKRIRKLLKIYNKGGQKNFDYARARTWNLLIRSQTHFHYATQPLNDFESS